MRTISTFYVKNNQVNSKTISIIGDDVKHIRNVLRHKIDDELEICDESGFRYLTKIKEFSENEILLEIVEQTDKNTEMPVKIDLYQGLPKSDKMDLIVQKTTELGVSSIITFFRRSWNKFKVENRALE